MVDGVVVGVVWWGEGGGDGVEWRVEEGLEEVEVVVFVVVVVDLC